MLNLSRSFITIPRYSYGGLKVKYFIFFLVFFSLNVEAQTKRYEWEESTIYLKPSLGFIMFGNYNPTVGSGSDVNIDPEFSPDAYDYFPSILAFSAGKKIVSDLFVEGEVAFFRSDDSANFVSHQENHFLFAVGPVFYFSNDTIITPLVSVNLGGLYSQYNSGDILEDDIVVDEITSFVAQAGAGIDFGFFEDIDFGINYKFMFIGKQSDLDVIESMDTITFDNRFGHRFEGSIRVGTNIF